MSSPPSSAPNFTVIGINHRTASGVLRERMASEETETPTILDTLKRYGMAEGLWLSTCDRSEIWFAPKAGHNLDRTVADFLAQRANCDLQDLQSQWMSLSGEAAVRHAFAVAASLDSQIIGEPHILGQLKAAHRAAAEAGLSGSQLDTVLQAAYTLAKRVRSETALAEGATSIVAAALQVARNLHGALNGCTALLLGNGDMGVMVLEGLQTAGLQRLTITAPIDRRAQTVARRLGCHTAAWEDLPTALAQADIVIAACGQGRLVLEAKVVNAALRQRRRRPIFLIDAAVPADIDPGVGAVDDAYLYDLGDLEKVVLAGRAGRETAQKAAWALLDIALAEFARDRAERRAAPLVVTLRAHFEAERRRVLAEHGGLDAGAATRLLVNRLLHHPTAMLRASVTDDGAAPERQAELEQMIAKLFGLSKDDA